MTEPDKIVTRREVLVDADLEPVSWSMEPANIDLGDEQSLVEWVAEQKHHGETAQEFAREMDALQGVTIYLQLVEHYDDGTSKRVEAAQWKDDDQ